MSDLQTDQNGFYIIEDVQRAMAKIRDLERRNAELEKELADAKYNLNAAHTLLKRRRKEQELIEEKNELQERNLCTKEDLEMLIDKLLEKGSACSCTFLSRCDKCANSKSFADSLAKLKKEAFLE